MSTAENIELSITGAFDKFDRAISVIDHAEHLLDEAEMPVEYHKPKKTLAGELFQAEQPGHFFDPKDKLRKKLERARQKIRESELLTQKTINKIP
jgi:hypothetical protein